MRLRHFVCLVLGLTACTHQQVEININRPGEYPITANKTVNGEKQAIDVVADKNSEIRVRVNGNSTEGDKPPGQTQPVTKVDKAQVDSCPKYTPPKFKPTPSVPVEIDQRKKMTDEKVIMLLTEYARDLRKTSIQNQTLFEMSYGEYLDSCKK